MTESGVCTAAFDSVPGPNSVNCTCFAMACPDASKAATVIVDRDAPSCVTESGVAVIFSDIASPDGPDKPGTDC